MSVPVPVVIKGVVVGVISVETGADPAITVTWKGGKAMHIVGPAVLVFHYGHRSVLIYWDGKTLCDRTDCSVNHAFPMCKPLVHANASQFCELDMDCYSHFAMYVFRKDPICKTCWQEIAFAPNPFVGIG